MKKDIEDAFEIMGFSIIPLVLTTDILFSIVVLIFKVLLYVIGGWLLLFGATALVKAFRNRNKQSNGA